MTDVESGRSGPRGFFNRVLLRLSRRLPSTNSKRRVTQCADVDGEGSLDFPVAVKRPSTAADGDADGESVTISLITTANVHNKPKVGACISLCSSNSGTNQDRVETSHHVKVRHETEKQRGRSSNRGRVKSSKPRKLFGSRLSVHSVFLSAQQGQASSKDNQKLRSQSASDLQRPCSELSACSSESVSDRESLITNMTDPLAATTITKKKKNSAKPKELDCPLCFAHLPSYLFPRLTNCSHRSCFGCLLQYLQLEILESRVIICCPECPESLHPCDIYYILAAEPHLINKWEEFSVRRVLMSDPDARWCPAPDCNYAVIATGCAGCPVLKCERPGCGTYFCYHCKQEWHADQTCDEARAQRWSFAPSAIPLDSTVKVGDIKACPRCQTYIVKMNDGSCNHMVCALCGAEFCWLCLKEISDLHYLSPSGCTFWGKKPWSRKKKLLWQLGTLIGAPVGIALVAGLAVPAIIFGVPVWMGRKIHQRLRRSSRVKHHFAVIGGVVTSILLSPVLAGLAVGVGVPIMLAYVYGVVPFSLCRNGTCGMTASSSGVRLTNLDDDLLAMTGLLTKDQSNDKTTHSGDSQEVASTVAGISLQSGSTNNRLQVQAEVFPYNRRRPSMESGVTLLGERINYEEASLRALAGSTYCDDKSVHTIGSANEVVSYTDDASVMGLAGSVCGARSTAGMSTSEHKNSILHVTRNTDSDGVALLRPTSSSSSAIARVLCVSPPIVTTSTGNSSFLNTPHPHTHTVVIGKTTETNTATTSACTQHPSGGRRYSKGSNSSARSFGGHVIAEHHGTCFGVTAHFSSVPRSVRESAEELSGLDEPAASTKCETRVSNGDGDVSSDNERNIDDASTKSLAGSLVAYDAKSNRSHNDSHAANDATSESSHFASESLRKLSPNTFIVCAECHKRASLDNCSVMYFPRECTTSIKEFEVDSSFSVGPIVHGSSGHQPSKVASSRHVQPKSCSNLAAAPSKLQQSALKYSESSDNERMSFDSFEGGSFDASDVLLVENEDKYPSCSILKSSHSHETPSTTKNRTSRNIPVTHFVTSGRSYSAIVPEGLKQQHGVNASSEHGNLTKSPSLSFVWDTIAAIQEVRRLRATSMVCLTPGAAGGSGSRSTTGSRRLFTGGCSSKASMSYGQSLNSSFPAAARPQRKFLQQQDLDEEDIGLLDSSYSTSLSPCGGTTMDEDQAPPTQECHCGSGGSSTEGQLSMTNQKRSAGEKQLRRFVELFTSPLHRAAVRVRSPRTSEGALFSTTEQEQQRHLSSPDDCCTTSNTEDNTTATAVTTQTSWAGPTSSVSTTYLSSKLKSPSAGGSYSSLPDLDTDAS